MLPALNHTATQGRHDAESRTSPFGNFTRSVLDELEKISYAIRYPPGFVLFAEGEPPRGVFILRSGHVKLFICSGDGKTLILRMANPGDVLGLPGTLSGTQCEATAETVGPCQLAFINRESFLRFMHAHHDVCLAVIDQLVSIYSGVCHEIRCVGLPHTVAEKLAKLLLQWPLNNGDTPSHIKFAFKHEEIAQMIGTSRETVSRVLAELKKKHIAELNGATLHIYDRGLLQAMAAGKEQSLARDDSDYFLAGGP